MLTFFLKYIYYIVTLSIKFKLYRSIPGLSSLTLKILPVKTFYWPISGVDWFILLQYAIQVYDKKFSLSVRVREEKEQLEVYLK